MKKVLLVEDDPFIRDITTVKLTEQSYAVLIAISGESVINMMKKEMPDVVLLDLNLPDLSGLEVLMLIKADPQIRDIPIIIFTNNDDPDTKAAAKELGTAGFFVKATTSFDDLLEHIEKVTSE